MPRYARMIIPEGKACYHVMSRTALDDFPFGDVEKDEFVRIVKKFSLIYFVRKDFVGTDDTFTNQERLIIPGKDRQKPLMRK